jgi:ABC-2 type transport system ATP-binding protein
MPDELVQSAEGTSLGECGPPRPTEAHFEARSFGGKDPPCPSVIQVQDLWMSYGALNAVCGINLDVRAGEVFAFLGPNGAGKTTTVEILEGYRHRTSGLISVLGADPASAGGDWRARIGVVLQESEPEPELTVIECVSLYAGYYPRSRPVRETLELVQLTECEQSRCGRLSGGQHRRLDVALALIGDPELLFLDEPTTGFDPSARRATWDVIAGLRDLGKTIFLTTHYMDEAEYLADRIAVIAHGRIVAEGTSHTLGDRSSRPSTVRFTLPPGLSVEAMPEPLRRPIASVVDRRVEAMHRSPLAYVGALSDWAQLCEFDLPDLQVNRPTLEEIYLELTEGES